MIELKNLTKMYGQTEVLKDVCYTFPNRGLVCLLGESGCGKTTLMNLTAGLDTDYSGKIIVDGTKLNSLSENDLCHYRKDYVGFVFQDYHLLNGYTVMENIVYPCVLKSDEPKKDRARAKELLDKMGLADKADEKVQNLSGGQKQRAAIARALIENPEILLADEPTGALDRKTSTEIMEILKEISKTKLVIVITHDRRICDYADEIITIENKKICVQKNADKAEVVPEKLMVLTPARKPDHFKLAYRNFKTAMAKYILISCIVAVGILCVVLSLCSGNIINQSIDDFKTKNAAFNNGYIKNDDADGIYDKLAGDERIENVYRQYKVENVSLAMDGYSETMAEKYPMPKTKETMSYGTMPRKGENEIALTPSLAKKFNPQINELIGQNMTLTYKEQKYMLTVSGIYNAGYDDFFVSSDVEQTFYKDMENENVYAISYDVKRFEDVVTVSKDLEKAGIFSENASQQVGAMQQTFSKLQTLFSVISGMIFGAAMLLIIIVLVKMQAVRYKLAGLLYAFGFTKKMVSKITAAENLLLTLSSVGVTALLLAGICVADMIRPFGLSLGIGEFMAALLVSGVLMFFTGTVINRKLVNTPPAAALRK